LLATAALLACLAFAPVAGAADVYQDKDTSDNLTSWNTVVLNASGFAFPNGSKSVDVYDGPVRVTNGVVPDGTAASWLMFCVDVHDFSTAPPSTFTGESLADYIPGGAKRSQVASLIDFGTQLLQGNPGGDLGYSYSELSAGLQIAIWTAENQSGTANYSPADSSRGFWVSAPSDANDVSAAQMFLQDVTDGTWKGGKDVVVLKPLQPSSNQTFALYQPVPAPEPAAIGLFGVGLLGLGLIRRRRA
jgi:hypothetical protein